MIATSNTEAYTPTQFIIFQERTSGALWALAGEHIEERLMMAERMTMQILNEFIDSKSPLLNLIGAEAMFALAGGPRGQHDKLNEGSCIPRLIALIQRPLPDTSPLIAGRIVSPESILLAAVRAVRVSCFRAGFVRHPINQSVVCEDVYGCLQTFVGMLTDAEKSCLIRAEVAFALGAVALGNVRCLLRCADCSDIYVWNGLVYSDSIRRDVTGIGHNRVALNYFTTLLKCPE